MERRKFTRAFTIEAVTLIQERGVTGAQAARDFGMHGTVLRRWVQESVADAAQAFQGQGQMKPEQAELARLRREALKLKAERDIFKKPRPTSRRRRCDVRLYLDTPRNLAGGMVVRGARGLARRLLVLADPVAECPGEGQRPAPEEGTIQLPASDRTYEARHVWHDLQRTESPAADIGSNGSCGTRRCVPVPDGVECRRILGFGRRNAVAPKVLDRTFTAYLWTAEGWLYVAAVVDLFSRRVVGWSMHATMTTQLVTDALVIVIWQRGKPAAVLHHSDRGSPSTREPFPRLLADHGVPCSMSRSGNCGDNAAMESFFSSLKTERTAAQTYRTRDQANADVFDDIERFSHPRRRHATLGYLSPMEFERQAELA